jgi:hypothetical protein
VNLAMMDLDAPAEGSTDTLELKNLLVQLGLVQYEQRLLENGFEDWETVTGITEADMTEMGFKLGDRRKLQRAIHDRNKPTTSKAIDLPSDPSLSSGGLPIIGARPTELLLPPQPLPRARRQYRRHPRPDTNAPRKPKTAYVLFTEHVRKDPAISRLSFAEIAKEVGKRWGQLPNEKREDDWETPAAESMQEYRAELERYKKEENYRRYQTYLDDFKRGQQKQNSTAQSDETALPTTGSSRMDHSSISLIQEKLQAVQQEGYNKSNPSNIDPHVSNTPPEYSRSSSDPGMEEVGRVLHGLGINPQYSNINAFPDESMTRMAIEAYFHGTGSLLYLWDHDEVLSLVECVYQSKSESTRLQATELFAISAIGSYCDGETSTMSIPETFLHFFLCLLSSHIDMSELRRMRLLTCLAICRFTNSVQSARILMCKSL